MDKTLLSLTHDELTRLGALATAREIEQQPSLWLKVYDLIAGRREELAAFMSRAFSHPDLEVVLTGAGSSAFIGEILAGAFRRYTDLPTRPLATTELLTHPLDFLSEEKAFLLISFARSGNSPESCAVVELSEKICKKVYHLVITCNKEGALAKSAGHTDSCLIVLPPESNDQSLVMTSSFTSMVLAGMLITRLRELDMLKNQVETLACYGEKILSTHLPILKKIAADDFNRAVFLGSGCMTGVARESQLKLTELTGGFVLGHSDSFLGFRHGPRAMIDPRTLIVYLFSNDEYACLYEKDLVRSVNSGEKGLVSLGIAENRPVPDHTGHLLLLSSGESKLDGDLLMVCYVLPAQIIGFFKSLYCDLKPDSPSKNGTITRVVEGVNIYQFNYMSSRYPAGQE